MAENRCKYYKQKKQVSYDNGVTWQDVIPYQYQKGELYEQESTDCGYSPLPTGGRIAARYNDGRIRVVKCTVPIDMTLHMWEVQPDGYTASAMTEAVIDCARTIGGSAFSGCESLTSVTISNIYTTIGGSAFAGCFKLTNITIPYSVTTIGNYAFSRCFRLTSINIPNRVTSLGAWAFEFCSGLTSVTLSNSLTSIGNYVFYGCSGLTSIGSVGSGASVEIPNSVTSIGTQAFSYCAGLTSIDIPNSVTSIDNGAFSYCSSLTSVNIPNSVTSIGYLVFHDCSGLTSVTVNATTPPTLGVDAFDNTNNCPIYVPCESVDLYKTAENWSAYADRIHRIEPCYYYRWVTMDVTVDYYCEGTTKYYKQKKQVSYDDGQTWQDVTPPEYQKGGAAEQQSTDCGYIPPTPTNKKLVATYSDSITNEVECNSSSELTSGETKPSGYEYTAMTSAAIGDCVTSIGERAFSGCTSLASIVISDSVTSIGTRVFYNCSGLTNINIPSGIAGIGYATFYNCYGLTSIVIPDSVGYIDFFAFYGCSGLTSITCLATTPPSLKTEAFENTSDFTIYVPAQSVDTYKSASVWSRYASRIRPIS